MDKGQESYLQSYLNSYVTPNRVMVFSGTRQPNFAGASVLLAQLLPQKPRQQNLRCVSKISDAPANSLTLIILTCKVKKKLLK
jgi:hypothetical protein